MQADTLQAARELIAQRDFAGAACLLARPATEDPPPVEFLLARAAALSELRQVDAALELLSEARQRAPQSSDVWGSLLSLALNTGKLTGAELAGWHKAFGAMLAGVTPVRQAGRRLGGRIRVGYLCGGFRTDPEMFFRAPIFQNHDRERFEIFAYATLEATDDEARLAAGAVEHFRCVAGLSDRETAEHIAADGIDILADMSGHFARGRLAVFAYRPAPVQISLPMYPATSGLRQMDYRIGDIVTDPEPWAPALYTEALIHLECGALCYQPPEAPPVAVLPADRNGYVTYGVFARPAKLTDDFLICCAELLRTAPDARILFHHAFNNPGPISAELIDPIAAIFARRGVDSSRLRFENARPLREHLELVSEVDIALDTFPYNGVTLTCECLWMGVPVVSLAGDCYLARAGASLLTRLGLGDWIASSADDFVSLSSRKSADREALRAIRARLRDAMTSSSLTNGRAYTRTLEAAYELAWQIYTRNGG